MIILGIANVCCGLALVIWAIVNIRNINKGK